VPVLHGILVVHRSIFLHRSAHLCLLVDNCVSPCLPPSCASLTLTDASLLLRLNSRDRIRAKFAAGVENGIVINPLVFTPGPNLGTDTTQGGTGVTIDTVTGFTDQNSNTVEPSLETVRLL
jgi:hypothetical protein